MTREDKARVIEAWKLSGLSGREYCRTNDLKYWTFRGWVKKEKPPSSHEKLVKLPLPKGSWEPVSSAGFDLLLQDLRIAVPADFNEESLLRLLRALRKAL